MMVDGGFGWIPVVLDLLWTAISTFLRGPLTWRIIYLRNTVFMSAISQATFAFGHFTSFHDPRDGRM